jgi:hypothetical protein
MAKSACFDGACNSVKGGTGGVLVTIFITVSVAVFVVVVTSVTLFVTVTVTPPVVVVTIVTTFVFVAVLVVLVVVAMVAVVILPGEVASCAAALSLTASISEITGGVTTANRPHFSINARRSAFP